MEAPGMLKDINSEMQKNAISKEEKMKEWLHQTQSPLELFIIPGDPGAEKRPWWHEEQMSHQKRQLDGYLRDIDYEAIKPTLSTRKVLPMAINGRHMDTVADTGSDENAMSEAAARQLGLRISSRPKNRKSFEIACGRKIKSSGQAMVECGFSHENGQKMLCTFNIFPRLVEPVIMGRHFLEKTETLTKHLHRLRDRVVDYFKPRRVMHLTRPAQRFRCALDKHPLLANVDTGSELDLVAYKYVREARLNMTKPDEGFETVQFADGSYGRLSGKVVADLEIDDGRGSGSLRGLAAKRTFHVLHGLTTDLLLGEQLAYEADIFNDHAHAFIDVENLGHFPQLNSIIWLRHSEQRLLGFLRAGKRKWRQTIGRDLFPEAEDNGNGEQINNQPFPGADVRSSASEAAFLEDLGQRDARELYRREQVDLELGCINSQRRSHAEEVEQARRKRYNDQRDKMTRGFYAKSSAPSSRGGSTPASAGTSSGCN